MSGMRLELEEIHVQHCGASRPVLRGVGLGLGAGEIIGILGPSGSGKSTLLCAIAGLLPLCGGEIRFEGRHLGLPTGVDGDSWRRLRGAGIGWIAQDPLAALHPMLTIGEQVAEGLGSADTAGERCRHWLEACGLEPAEHFVDRYPHQLSGGERQRALLALCLAREPRLILADEPTSMLDPVLAREWMELLVREVRRRGASLVFVTHEEQRIVPHADRLLRLEAGQLHAHEIRRLEYPRIPRSRGELAARIRGLCVRRDRRAAPAVESLDLDLHLGEIVAVIGSSGAGKSSLALAIAGHIPHEAGSIEFPGNPRMPRVQLCFQDPRASFDPRRSLRRSLLDSGADPAQLPGLLADLGLAGIDLDRRPEAFSGGERARLAWLRARLAQPRLLVYDEPLAALDPDLRMSMVEHWQRLAAAGGHSQLLVSHDMQLVSAVADRVLVLENGRCVEQGRTAQLFAAPGTAALRALLST